MNGKRCEILAFKVILKLFKEVYKSAVRLQVVEIKLW